MRLIPAALLRRLGPSDTLTPAETERGVQWLIRNGVAGQVMDTFTAGAILTAYARALGASNFVIGLLAALPYLSQLVQVPGVYLVERLRARRLISVVACLLSRPMFLVVAGAAFVPDRDMALALVAAAFALRYGITAMMTCSWESWIRDLVPEGRLGRVIGRRLMVMTTVGTVLALLAAAYVDGWVRWSDLPAKYGYVPLLVIAFLGGLVSVWLMAQMPEPRMAPAEGDPRLLRRLAEPFRDPNYRRLMAFLGSWNFAINLAAPFFTVHMLQRIGLDLTTVMILTTLSQFANIAVLRQWGKIADRFSNKSVLAVCAPLFVACIFGWIFTTVPDERWAGLAILAAIHVLTGIATAGVTLASGNIAMKLAPRGDAAVYLADNSLVNSAAAGLAPMIGGLTADFFMTRELALTLRWRAPGTEVAFDTLAITQWEFYFVIATVLGLFSIYRLTRVQETGEVSERVLLGEILLGVKRSVRNFSSIAGLRTATEFPLILLGRRTRRARPAAATAEATESGDAK